MPFLRLTLTGPIPDANRAAIGAGLTALMASRLHKKAELTALLIDSPSQGRWSIGGRAVPVAAHLEVSITAGTNSAEEKAGFIADAMALLRAQTGLLPEATYIVIRELPASDWGYDGRTQESRRPAPVPAPAPAWVAA